MTLTSTLALFVSMIVLALLPGPGILVVVARTLASDFKHGIATSAGIVAGDYVFIILSVFGLVSLAGVMGDFFIVIKYIGALYLLWLGVKILIERSADNAALPTVNSSGYFAHFFAGLLTTLSNPKAILFYLSFFPTFLDLSKITTIDLGVILTITAITVGGVMVGYAYLTHKTRSSLQGTKKSKIIRYVSSALLIGSGVLIAINA